MKILVTGASGFLGRFLTVFVQEKGHEVMGLSSKNCDLRKKASSDPGRQRALFHVSEKFAGWSGGRWGVASVFSVGRSRTSKALSSLFGEKEESPTKLIVFCHCPLIHVPQQLLQVLMGWLVQNRWRFQRSR